VLARVGGRKDRFYEVRGEGDEFGISPRTRRCIRNFAKVVNNNETVKKRFPIPAARLGFEIYDVLSPLLRPLDCPSPTEFSFNRPGRSDGAISIKRRDAYYKIENREATVYSDKSSSLLLSHASTFSSSNYSSAPAPEVYRLSNEHLSDISPVVHCHPSGFLNVHVSNARRSLSDGRTVRNIRAIYLATCRPPSLISPDVSKI